MIAAVMTAGPAYLPEVLARVVDRALGRLRVRGGMDRKLVRGAPDAGGVSSRLIDRRAGARGGKEAAPMLKVVGSEAAKTVLRDLKRRGMPPPVVAVGDGALGFWAAVRGVWPETRAQRDWFH